MFCIYRTVDMVVSAFLILRINILLFTTYPFKKMAGLSKKSVRRTGYTLSYGIQIKQTKNKIRHNYDMLNKKSLSLTTVKI